MPQNASAWAKAEILARRIYELTTVPMRSENHPTWDQWRTAINKGLSAIGRVMNRRWSVRSTKSTDWPRRSNNAARCSRQESRGHVTIGRVSLRD